MEVIHWTLILSLALPCYIMAVVQQRNFLKLENSMFSGNAISNTTTENALQCAFLCDHHGCVGFNTKAATDESVYCTTFIAHDGLIESQLASGWTDGCKVDICGMEDVGCLNSVEVNHDICLCPEAYILGSSGFQVTCSVLYTCCSEGDGTEPAGICNSEEAGYYMEEDECKMKLWRGDLKCWNPGKGVDNLLPNGSPAQCNPLSNYCCSTHGNCGEEEKHCVTYLYVDYRAVQITTTPVITTPETTSSDCSLIITASDAETAVWQTPNYNGVDHYPDEDYSCWLNITIPDTYSMFMVSLTMVSNSSIYMKPGCTKDRLIHYGSNGQQISSCGDLAGISWSETATFNTPLSFSFKFCSDTSDGGTDIGFKMDIEMKNLMG